MDQPTYLPVRSHTDVGGEGLALSLRSNSSTPDSVILVFMDLALSLVTVMLKEEEPAPNCSN